MPKKIFITRHRGAVTWAAESGVKARKIELENFDPAEVQQGDIVMGTLPVHIAANVNARGGHYWHLSMDIPTEFRGKELSALQMREFGARLEEFKVQGLGTRVSESPDMSQLDDGTPAAIHMCIASKQTLPNLIPLIALPWQHVVIFASVEMQDQADHLAWLADLLSQDRDQKGGRVQIVTMPAKLDWQTLAVFAAQQASAFLGQGRIDFNITGGQKLMSMAMGDAFRAHARLLYCATDTHTIEVVDAVQTPPIRLAPGLLELELYLAAQGFKTTRRLMNDGGDAARTIFDRQSLTASLVRGYAALDKVPFNGELALGADAGGKRFNLRYQPRSLLRVLHALGAESASKTGNNGKPFEPFVLIKPFHPAPAYQNVWSALTQAQLIRQFKCTAPDTNGRVTVTFEWTSPAAASYVAGGYLEEYVWLCMAALDIAPHNFAGNVGLARRNFSTKKTSKELNEIDVAAVWQNRLLVLECKAGVQLHSGKDQDIMNKLDQLKDNAGGAMGKAWLISPAKINNQDVFDRAQLNGITIIQGPEALKGLCQSLAKELGAKPRHSWPPKDLIKQFR